MKKIDWESVDAGSDGGFADLPNGAYVCRVTDVVDDERHVAPWGGEPYPAIIIRYEIAEGDHKDFFAKNKKPDWLREYEFRYDPASCTDERDAWRPGEFKRFWSVVLPESNAGWQWDGTAESFVGKLFGARIRHYRYLKNNGEEGDRLEMASFVTADHARSGEAKVPEDRVSKQLETKRAQAGEPAQADDDDIPF